MKKLLWVGWCSMLAIGCGPAQSEIEVGATSRANHAWGNYHWARTSNPFTLSLGDSVSNNWDGYLATASSDWSQSTVLDTQVAAGNGTRARQCRATSGSVEVCNTTYGNNGWLGVAGISVQGSHITKAYVKLNDTYFNTPTYNTTAWRNLVMCQEVGHTFGLDHQDENFDNQPLGTCMDYSSDPVPNQHPNRHDYDQLEAIYQHLDSTNTVGQGGASGSSNAGGVGHQIDLGDGAEDVGALIAQDGLWSLYERDLGNGRKVITSVIWAQ